MPTYDYRCSHCAEEFEVFQRITAEPGANCPKCGSPARRLVSGGTGLIFKGSGFYITDYKRKGADGASGETGASPSSSPKSEGATSSDSQKSEGASAAASEKPQPGASSGDAPGKAGASSPSPAKGGGGGKAR